MRLPPGLAALAGAGALLLFAAACGEPADAQRTALPLPTGSAASRGPADAAASAARLADAEQRIARLEFELAAVREARLAALEEVRRLGRELRAEQGKSFDRELEWLEYNRTIAGLDLKGIDLLFRAQGLTPPGREPEPEAPPEDPAVVAEREARALRAERIHASLRALLAAEEVRGIDLMTVGTLGDGWVGPVVFRVLDGRGRLAGSLVAERLRIEGSFAAHTLTLVLADGHESQGGVRTPFEGGERRVVLPHVDPTGWLDACPELFTDLASPEPADDGAHDLTRLRLAWNELLTADAAHGYWKLHSIGGASGERLTRVQLSQHDPGGALVQRVFADELAVERRGEGVRLVLKGGASLRGDQKSPFLGGRFEIWLPNASLDAWTRAGILSSSAVLTGNAGRSGAPPDAASLDGTDDATDDAPDDERDEVRAP